MTIFDSTVYIVLRYHCCRDLRFSGYQARRVLSLLGVSRLCKVEIFFFLRTYLYSKILYLLYTAVLAL